MLSTDLRVVNAGKFPRGLCKLQRFDCLLDAVQHLPLTCTGVMLAVFVLGQLLRNVQWRGEQ